MKNLKKNEITSGNLIKKKENSNENSTNGSSINSVDDF